VRIIDFMPIGVDERTDVVRILEGLEGEVPIEVLLGVRFGYGAEPPMVEVEAEGVIFTSGPNSTIFRAPSSCSLSGATCPCT
jgi:hypothetical protein